jgi:hypothetical protein
MLAACSDDSSGTDYPFERSVLELTASKRCADRKVEPGDPCYLLKWRHPIERANLLRYHVWLDTAVIGDTTRSVPEGALAKSIKIDYVDGRGDFDSLDLTTLLKDYLDRDSLHVAIWAEYGDGGNVGAVQRLYLFFGDDVAPTRVQFVDSTNQNTLWLDWTRSTDQVDFYFPDFISGPIAGYNLHVYAEDASEDLLNLKVQFERAGGRPIADGDSVQFLRHHCWRSRNDSLVLDTTTRANKNHLRLAILDGRGFQDSTDSNLFRVRITGLRPEKNYGVSISVWDSAGNSTGTDSDASGRVVMTTDTVAPLMATKLWLRADSLDSGKPRLDSNRLVLYWPRSVDPLTPKSFIELTSKLTIPSGCLEGKCYREVARYIVDIWKNGAWEAATRAGGTVADKYQTRYNLVADTMKQALDGMYVSDTLRWVLPGDTVVLRLRAVDSSGHISKAFSDTVVVSRGPLYNVACPAGYMPSSRTTAVGGVSSKETFCVEKFEHRNGAAFARNVLYGDARGTCQALTGTSGFENFTVDLCREDLWRAACVANGRSTYGTIEESPFTALEFLFQHCNVGTWDSASAASLASRDPFCASPDGIRDLPGQLQEWAVGTQSVYDSVTKKTSIDTIPVLKGTSYVLFEGADRTDLAQCAVRARPHRVRPAYTEDSVWLYRSGSTVDTVFAKDTSRTLYAVIPPTKFTDTLLVYDIVHPVSGAVLGQDYVEQAEYQRRGGDAWLKVLWTGLSYKAAKKKSVLIKGTRKATETAVFYVEPSVGFRCCAQAK